MNAGIETQQAYNLEKAEWKSLKQKIREYLPNINELAPDTMTANKVDILADNITTAITKALEETTPRKRTCPFSKQWWNKVLTEL